MNVINPIRNMILLAIGLWVFSGCTIQGLQKGSVRATPAIWGELKPGRFRALFQTFYLEDQKRSWCEETDSKCELKGRPVRLFMWLPASAVSGSPLRFGDWLDIDPDNPDFQYYDNILDANALAVFERQFFGADAKIFIEKLKAEPTFSFPEGVVASKNVPLVLVSLGRNNFQMESTVLWEYLASHGYAVAVVPQMGLTSLDNRIEFSIEDMSLQSEDLRFVLNEIKSRQISVADPVAIIGHSSGAVAAALLANDAAPRIKSLVSLDGSITTEDGRILFEQLGWSGERIAANLLNIYRSDKRSFDTFFNEFTRDKGGFDVGVKNTIHFDYQQWPLYNQQFLVSEPRSEKVRSPDRAANIVRGYIELIEIFLSCELEGTKTECDTLNASEIPDGLSLEEFKSRAARKSSLN